MLPAKLRSSSLLDDSSRSSIAFGWDWIVSKKSVGDAERDALRRPADRLSPIDVRSGNSDVEKGGVVGEGARICSPGASGERGDNGGEADAGKLCFKDDDRGGGSIVDSAPSDGVLELEETVRPGAGGPEALAEDNKLTELCCELYAGTVDHAS